MLIKKVYINNKKDYVLNINIWDFQPSNILKKKMFKSGKYYYTFSQQVSYNARLVSGLKK